MLCGWLHLSVECHSTQNKCVNRDYSLALKRQTAPYGLNTGNTESHCSPSQARMKNSWSFVKSSCVISGFAGWMDGAKWQTNKQYSIVLKTKQTKNNGEQKYLLSNNSDYSKYIEICIAFILLQVQQTHELDQ